MDPTQIPLKDWHYPEAITWWPIAPGWWMLFCLAVFLLAAWFYLRWRRLRPSVKKIARKELASLRTDPDLSASDRIRKLSILIRRIALSVYPRSEAAKLTGVEWLRFLDQGLADRAFSEGAGKILIDAPYRKTAEFEQEAIFALCERWIESLPNTSARQAEPHPK